MKNLRNDSSDEPCMEIEESASKETANNCKSDDDVPIQEEATRNPNRKQSSNSASSHANCLTLLQKVRSTEYYNIRNVTWLVVTATLTTVCIWHVVDRCQYYYREPTTFQVSVERLNELQFPSLTICPAREPFHDESWDEAFRSPDVFDLLKANVSADEIWEEYAIRESDITVTASCNASKVCDFLNGVNTKLKTTVLLTFWGTCATLMQDFPTDYRGLSTFWAIFLQPGPYARQWFDRPAAAQFFFHEPNIMHRHEAFLFADLLSPEQVTVIQLTLKKFVFLNLSRDPCDTPEKVIQCKNKCLDSGLDIVLNCSLPFMTSKWPPCQTPIETKRSFEQARNFYYTFNWSECTCNRQCKENVYSANTNSAFKSGNNNSVLIVQFADNLIEIVYEEHSYSFSALISDIGGSVGIFLGLSILSMFQLFDEHFLNENKKKKES